jgi:hypothetical protein
VVEEREKAAMMALVILEDLQGRNRSGGHHNESGAVRGHNFAQGVLYSRLCERQLEESGRRGS